MKLIYRLTLASMLAVSCVSLHAYGLNAPDKLYFTNQSPNGVGPIVVRTNLDGTGQETLLSSPTNVQALALDSQKGHFYLGQGDDLTRYNLDGTNPSPIFTGLGFNWGTSSMAIHQSEGKIYLANQSPNGVSPIVVRMNLDGSNQQTLVTSSTNVQALVLDHLNSHFYLGQGEVVTRYDLDGNNPTPIANGLGFNWGTSDMAIDPLANKLYLTNQSPNGVGPIVLRMNLDGSDQETLLVSPTNVQAIILAPHENHMYLAQGDDTTRYDLDGNNPTPIFNGLGFNWGTSDAAIGPIPEPSTLAACMLLAGCGLTRRRSTSAHAA